MFRCCCPSRSCARRRSTTWCASAGRLTTKIDPHSARSTCFSRARTSATTRPQVEDIFFWKIQFLFPQNWRHIISVFISASCVMNRTNRLSSYWRLTCYRPLFPRLSIHFNVVIIISLRTSLFPVFFKSKYHKTSPSVVPQNVWPFF